MAKKDGKKLIIKFTEKIISDASTAKDAFFIKYKEYDKTPEGDLIDIVRHVVRVENAEDRHYVNLYFDSGITRSFQNVTGDITVVFDSEKGSLSGQGGPVASFEKSFTPEGLEYKPNIHNPNHIEITNLKAIGNLIKINYKNTKNDEHIEIMAVKAEGLLTKVEDI